MRYSFTIKEGLTITKRYIVSLNECVTDQVITDFDAFGAEIIWASKLLPTLIAIETSRSLEDINNFFLVESAHEERTGTLNC